jgi:hypothetical protein
MKDDSDINSDIIYNFQDIVQQLLKQRFINHGYPWYPIGWQLQQYKLIQN